MENSDFITTNSSSTHLKTSKSLIHTRSIFPMSMLHIHHTYCYMVSNLVQCRKKSRILFHHYTSNVHSLYIYLMLYSLHSLIQLLSTSLWISSLDEGLCLHLHHVYNVDIHHRKNDQYQNDQHSQAHQNDHQLSYPDRIQNLSSIWDSIYQSYSSWKWKSIHPFHMICLFSFGLRFNTCSFRPLVLQ